MKDSQLLCLLLVASAKYIKADNERFSTECKLIVVFL